MNIKFRILVTYEKLAIDKEGDQVYGIKQNWTSNKNAQKTVK